MNREEVIEKIKSAWSEKVAPAPSEIANDNSGRHLECNAVSAFFAGKNWQDVTWPVLSQYKGDRSACLYFMSSEAFRYYLAAYMLIAICSHAEADVAGNAAWCGLEPDKAAGHLDGFTAVQRSAILEFIEYMQFEHGNDYPYGEHPKMLQYWRAAL